VKSGLGAFGVEAILTDDHTIDANWMWSNLLGGVKVQVSESKAAEARSLIEAEPGNEQDANETEISITICPICSSSESRYFLDKRGSFLTWLVLGFPVIPSISKRACANCGHKWRILPA